MKVLRTSMIKSNIGGPSLWQKKAVHKVQMSTRQISDTLEDIYSFESSVDHANTELGTGLR